MNDCFFCKSLQSSSSLDFVSEVELEQFIAAWDTNPVTPGHVIILPKRHAQFMHELTPEEGELLVKAVLTVKNFLAGTNLQVVYHRLIQNHEDTKSEAYLRRALALVTGTNRPPDAFNDGLNDGPAAGQTVPHFHWHVMPRWQGDMPDPRGGIRHMFPGLGNYHEGLASNQRNVA